MADELDATIRSALQQGFDHPLSVLRGELAERLSRDFGAAKEAAAAQAARSSRGATVEALNIAVRRIRHASSITEIGAALLETAAGYCGRAALMVHKGESLAGWQARGFDEGVNGFADSWPRFHIPVAAAPALAQVIETRDAVVSLGLPGHLSQELANLFAVAPEEKVYLFPLSVRQKVVAILYADSLGAAEPVQPAALELLCFVAEASIEVLSARPPQAGQREAGEAASGRLELPAAPSSHPAPAGWHALSPSEREMHLRAQRFARVLVADLQLYRSQEIREGKRMRNLYGSLKEEIDKSREVYQRKFGQSLSTGIDYFHLELVRTLAGDQEALLGPDYPGPMMEPMFG